MFASGQRQSFAVLSTQLAYYAIILQFSGSLLQSYSLLRKIPARKMSCTAGPNNLVMEDPSQAAICYYQEFMISSNTSVGGGLWATCLT